MKTVLTAAELARALKISVSQVSRLAKLGKIPARDVSTTGKNHKWVFVEEVIEKWLTETPPKRAENPVRRRRQNARAAATHVQRSINNIPQVVEKQRENGQAHGTLCPVNVAASEP